MAVAELEAVALEDAVLEDVVLEAEVEGELLHPAASAVPAMANRAIRGALFLVS
jgi:hypothetical protein